MHKVTGYQFDGKFFRLSQLSVGVLSSVDCVCHFVRMKIFFLYYFRLYHYFRLVATCKKLEVDYFANKVNHRPDGSETGQNCSKNVIENDDDDDEMNCSANCDKNENAKETASIAQIDTIEPKVVKQEDEEKEDDLHGDWEKEQLKIVEDYESSDISQSANDTLNSSIDETVEKVMERSSDNKKSLNLDKSSSSDLMSTTDDSDAMQPNDEVESKEKSCSLMKKRSQSFDEAQSKKFKITHEIVASDLGELSKYSTVFFSWNIQTKMLIYWKTFQKKKIFFCRRR